MEHVPSLAKTLHAMQIVVHKLLQQTPSTQFPLVHWSEPPHADPFAFFALQVVPMQYAFSAQSLDVVHMLRQAAPMQS